MSEWKSVRLKDVASNASRGFDFRRKAAAIFINTGDVLDGYFLHNELSDLRSLPGQAKKAIRKGDILYSEIRPGNGRHALVQQDLPDYVVSTKFMVLESKPGMLPEFLYHVLKSPECESEFKLIAESRSGTFPQITFDAVSHYEFQLPPLDEQRAIALILGTLDDKIELNRRTNETLEAMARAIFKSWFVDFDPVRAKASGEPPESICRRLGLTPELLALFPDDFEESELGTIPSGWTVSTISALAEIVGGGTPSTKEAAYWDGGEHCWVTPKDLSRLATPVLLTSERRITDAGLAQIGSGLLPKGTVLLSSRAPIGYRAIAEVPVAVNQGFIAMQAKAGVSSYFLLYWAESAHQEIVGRANGSTFLEISKSNFRPIPLVAPPKAVFDAFHRLLEPIYQRMVANERETTALAEQRDTLLPRLLAGEMDIAGMEMRDE